MMMIYQLTLSLIINHFSAHIHLSPAMLTTFISAPPSSSTTIAAASSYSTLFTNPLVNTYKTTHNHTYKIKNTKFPSLKVQAMIEKENLETERPLTFLRESEASTSSDSETSVRYRFEKMIREAQDSVCAAIEVADGGGKFKEDVWSRPGGGGGISRVLQDGAVWEKAGVNVSVVYGVMPPEAYRAAKPSGDNGNAVKPGPVPFFAAGISSVMLFKSAL